MNSNWFRLPILYNGIFPENIRKLSEKLEIPPQQIAERDGVDDKVLAYHWIRREAVQMIVSITQIPEYPGETLIEFIDGSSTVCYMNHSKLIKYIDEFLSLEPTIIMIPMNSAIKSTSMSTEEQEEMGEHPYFNEEE